jgi:hypothetical protein
VVLLQCASSLAHLVRLARCGCHCGQAIIEDEALPTSLRTAAADAVDFGLSILYPTPKERKELLTTLISKVGVGVLECWSVGVLECWGVGVWWGLVGFWGIVCCV